MSVSSAQSDLPSTGLAWVTLAVSTGALLLLCLWALFNKPTLFPDKYLASVDPALVPAAISAIDTKPQDANLLASQAAQKAQIAQEKLAAEQVAAAQLADAKMEQERLATAQLAAANLAEAKLEQERLAAEQLAAATLEEERLAAEQLAAELAEAKLEQERLAAEQLAAATLEEERLAAEQLAAELAEAKLEQERLAAEQLAAATLEEERLVAEQLAAELAEAKLEQERLAAEQLAAAALEEERLAAAKLEEERFAAEQVAVKKLAQTAAKEASLIALAGPVRNIPEVQTLTATSDAASGNETPFETLRREELSALSGLAARVRFLPNETDVQESSKKPVDRLFELLFLYSETTVTVQVTSNEFEIDSNNKLISRERALTLVNYLIERGLDETAFQDKGVRQRTITF